MARMPQSKSLCPPMYFVPECITISAPHLNGSWRGGGPKVASMVRIAPRAWALAAYSAIFDTLPVGFKGVSM